MFYLELKKMAYPGYIYIKYHRLYIYKTGCQMQSKNTEIIFVFQLMHAKNYATLLFTCLSKKHENALVSVFFFSLPINKNKHFKHS